MEIKMENTNKNVSQDTFDEVEQVIQDMVTSMRLLVKSHRRKWRDDVGYYYPGDILSGSTDSIVKTMYEKLLDVALAAQKEFYAQMGLRVADRAIEDMNEKPSGWEVLMTNVINVGSQQLTINPDDVESVDFSLPAEIIEKGNGIRELGQRSLILDIKFKEGSEGPQWTQPMEVVE